MKEKKFIHLDDDGKDVHAIFSDAFYDKLPTNICDEFFEFLDENAPSYKVLDNGYFQMIYFTDPADYKFAVEFVN